MQEVTVGLIGLGFMGTTHAGIYRSLPGVRLAALADLDPAKRSGDVSAVCGNIGGGDNSKPFDLEGVQIFDDPGALIASAQVDIIDICVPTPDHSQLICMALNAGRNVFCEKPLCRHPGEIDAIADALKKAKGFFNVGMCIRAWGEYDHARSLVLSGKIGAVRSAHFRRMSPSVAGTGWNDWYMKEAISGGAALDLHLHDTDFVVHTFGKPRSVRSFGACGVVGDGGIDRIWTRYEFGSGALVTAEGSWAADRKVPFEMSFEIICERATIKLDASGYHVYHADGTVETPAVSDASLPTGWHRELKYFTDCVREKRIPEQWQNPASVFDAIRTVFAEMKSVKENKEVEVSRV